MNKRAQKVAPITAKKVSDHIKGLKTRKAPGENGIDNIVFTYVPIVTVKFKKPHNKNKKKNIRFIIKFEYKFCCCLHFVPRLIVAASLTPKIAPSSRHQNLYDTIDSARLLRQWAG